MVITLPAGANAVASPPAIAHITELCNNIRGTGEVSSQLGHSSSAQNLRVRAVVGGHWPRTSCLELCKVHASVPPGTAKAAQALTGEEGMGNQMPGATDFGFSV